MSVLDITTAKPPQIPSDVLHTQGRFNTLFPEKIIGPMPVWKNPVRTVSTSNIPNLSGYLIVNGVQLAEGDRILVAGQTPALNRVRNGIYVVHEGQWQRAVDLLVGFPASGTTVYSLQAGSMYICTNQPNNDIVGVAQLIFTAFSGGGGGGGGGGEPGGEDTQVQYNHEGAFAGSQYFTYQEDVNFLPGQLVKSLIRLGDTNLLGELPTPGGIVGQPATNADGEFNAGGSILLAGGTLTDPDIFSPTTGGHVFIQGGVRVYDDPDAPVLSGATVLAGNPIMLQTSFGTETETMVTGPIMASTASGVNPVPETGSIYLTTGSATVQSGGIQLGTGIGDINTGSIDLFTGETTQYFKLQRGNLHLGRKESYIELLGPTASAVLNDNDNLFAKNQGHITLSTNSHNINPGNFVTITLTTGSQSFSAFTFITPVCNQEDVIIYCSVQSVMFEELVFKVYNLGSVACNSDIQLSILIIDA